MIDEKRLIEELENPKTFETQCEITIDDIVGIIKEQPQIICSDCTRRRWYQKGYQDGLNADKWIPCSERLPSEDEYVLCQGNHSQFIACIDSLDGKWRDNHYITRSKVIAWQPLQQPYKKEGAE